MNRKQTVELIVRVRRHLSDMELIANTGMGDFSESQASKFHAAVEALSTFLAAVEEMYVP